MADQIATLQAIRTFLEGDCVDTALELLRPLIASIEAQEPIGFVTTQSVLGTKIYSLTVWKLKVIFGILK